MAWTEKNYIALVHELTELDIRESNREEKKGLSVNIYRLGHLLGAAQRMQELIDHGAEADDAFSECFTPTRPNAAIARRLGFDMQVINGQWTWV